MLVGIFTLAILLAVVSFKAMTAAQGMQARDKLAYGTAALPGERVGQDVDGPYTVDPNWPKPISALPGHEKWT